MPSLFVYGTLADLDIQQKLFEQKVVSEEAILYDYSLFKREDGFLFIKECNGKSVNGYILELTLAQIWKADQWEELPYYERIEVQVSTAGGSKNAYAYINIYKEGVDSPGMKFANVNKEVVLKQLEEFKRGIEYDKLPFGDFYILIPCTLKTDFTEKNFSDTKSIDDNFLKTFEDTSNNEYDSKLNSEIKRYFMGSFEIVALEDNRTNAKELTRQKSNIYLSIHNLTKLAVLFINLPAYIVPPLFVLDQLSRGDLMISGRKSQDSERINDFLDSFGIKISGKFKSAIFLSEKPSEHEIMQLLAGEVNETTIVSKKLSSILKDNIAQYESAEIYSSEICVVEIPKSFKNTYEERLNPEILTLFCIELLLFQESTLGKVNSRVSDELHPQNYNSKRDSLEIIEMLGSEFSKSMVFWDIRNFKYKTAQNLADEFSKAFGLERVFKSYEMSKATLEQLIHIHTARITERENKIINSILIILAIVQGLPTIYFISLSILKGEMKMEELLSATITSLIAIMFLLIFNIRKKNYSVEKYFRQKK